LVFNLDDENTPLYTVGQVAQLLAVKQAFLRRCDELRVVSPRRSAGGQRRYSRVEIRVIQQVATMADEGMTLPAIRRIIELEARLADVTRQRDELGRQRDELVRQRDLLAHKLAQKLERPTETQWEARRAARAPEEPPPGHLAEPE
jgi:DNA-binding transcriptional MerR regulator